MSPIRRKRAIWSAGKAVSSAFTVSFKTSIDHVSIYQI